MGKKASNISVVNLVIKRLHHAKKKKKKATDAHKTVKEQFKKQQMQQVIS